MKETEYTYAVAYMRTLENKMLGANDIEGLFSADSVQSAIKLLQDKGFGRDLIGNETIDELLKSELEKVWFEAREACPENAPLEILLYKNDFHNLKTIIKAIIAGADWQTLILKPCTADPESIAEAIKTTDFSELPEFMREAAKKAYEIIAETNDGQLLEVYLDKVAWEEMYKRAETEKSDFLTGWIELNIRIANMKVAARAVGRSKDVIKNAVIDVPNCGSDKLVTAAMDSIDAVEAVITEMGYPEASELLKESFSAFEKWCDNQKIEYIKKAKLMCFGFEPILAFLIGKEFELQTVRIILSGKLNNVPDEIIRERLRDMYV